MLALCAWGPVLAQTGGQPAPAPAIAKPPHALPPDIAFARFIALIRGHLLTGDELAVRRQWDAAQPHVNFPTEEIYGVIRDDLRIYKTPPFDGALKALSRAVKARSAKQYSVALRRVESALAAAETGLKNRQPNWPRFSVEVAVEVLKTATDEYDDALANGRIVRPIGYQTARGFILQADRMIEGVAGELAPEPLSELRAALDPLKRAFGLVTAPKQAVMSSAAMSEQIARVEAAARLVN